jgi:hypothetical protein
MNIPSIHGISRYNPFSYEEYMSKNTNWSDAVGEVVITILKELFGGKK